MNKRDFLITGTATLAAAQAAADAVSTPSADRPVLHRPASRPELLGAVTASEWQAYVGDHFQFNGELMVLERVESLASPTGQTRFDLVFRASIAGAAASGLGTLRHGSTGQQLMLHLQDGQDTRSVAHFNLIAPSMA